MAISLIIQFNPESKERMIDHTFNQLEDTKFKMLPYSQHHERIYISALKMFYDKPLFGVGTNLFEYECKKEKYMYKTRSCSSHPHNYYIQLLAELGVIGFLFIFIFLIFLSFLVLKQFYFNLINRKNSTIIFNDFVVILSLIVFYFPLVPNMSLYNNWNNIMIMIPLSLLMNALYYKNNLIKNYG